MYRAKYVGGSQATEAFFWRTFYTNPEYHATLNFYVILQLGPRIMQPWTGTKHLWKFMHIQRVEIFLLSKMVAEWRLFPTASNISLKFSSLSDFILSLVHVGYCLNLFCVYQEIPLQIFRFVTWEHFEKKIVKFKVFEAGYLKFELKQKQRRRSQF